MQPSNPVSLRLVAALVVALGLIASISLAQGLVAPGLGGILAFEDDDSESSDDLSSDDDSSLDGYDDEPSDDVSDELDVRCVSSTARPHDFTLRFGGAEATGTYASPQTAPTHLVVVAHGWGHGVESWRPHLERMAGELGVLAVFVNYRGNVLFPEADEPYKDPPHNTIPTYRGWPVRAGSEDLRAATHFFFDACASIDTTVLYAVSMGSNVGGFLLAENGAGAPGATRSDGAPLFDSWFAIEGVHDMIETYTEANGAGVDPARVNATAAEDIEAETGGTPATHPLEYAWRTNLLRANDVANAGLDRVIYIHAVYDALIPWWQSRKMKSALNVPTEFHNLLRSADGPDGTVLQDYLNLEQGSEPTWQGQPPLVGHASEKDGDHLVMRTAFKRLADLVNGVPYACGEYVVDEPEPGTGDPEPLLLLQEPCAIP